MIDGWVAIGILAYLWIEMVAWLIDGWIRRG